MKELSIEEKARRYDEAIERAKSKIKNDKDHVLYEDDIIDIFHELKESEDERIRKVQLNYWRSVGGKEWHGVPVQEAIAWLERQGEKKPLNKIKMGKEYKCIASPRYSTFMKGSIYRPEDKFLCSLMNSYSYCFEPIEDDEQKPAFEMKTPEESLSIDSDTYNKIVDECIYGDDKSTWSEEDEKRIKKVIHILSLDGRISNEELKSILDWLKSFRPNRDTYNPYKEVVESISEMCKHYDKTTDLQDFYDNVKVKCKDAKEYDSLFP